MWPRDSPPSGSASPLVLLMGSKVGMLQDHPNGIALAWGTGETSDYLLSEVAVCLLSVVRRCPRPLGTWVSLSVLVFTEVRLALKDE